MESEISLVMKAPREVVFRTAADVADWPRILPHYRWVRVIERNPDRMVIQMAARRGWIPVRWTSELEIDAEAKEIHFHHLKAFTRGMRVVWKFDSSVGGTRVRILHHLTSTIPLIGDFIAERIIRDFFIDYIARRTLRSMQHWVEGGNGK
jgi:ribosome-associated toxin RatA of RatAB toxin-antitoxin module